VELANSIYLIMRADINEQYLIFFQELKDYTAIMTDGKSPKAFELAG
jgi:hypothetical protein